MVRVFWPMIQEGARGIPPARHGVRRFDAVEVIVGPPALADGLPRGLVLPAFVVSFDSPGLDLTAHSAINQLLSLLNLLGRFLVATDQVDGGPGQERPHGVQIRPVDIAAHDRGLEGDARRRRHRRRGACGRSEAGPTR